MNPAASWTHDAARLPLAFAQVREDPRIDAALLKGSGGDTAALVEMDAPPDRRDSSLPAPRCERLSTDQRHAEEFFLLIESKRRDDAKRESIERGLALGAHAFDRLYRDLHADGVRVTA